MCMAFILGICGKQKGHAVNSRSVEGTCKTRKKQESTTCPKHDGRVPALRCLFLKKLQVFRREALLRCRGIRRFRLCLKKGGLLHGWSVVAQFIGVVRLAIIYLGNAIPPAKPPATSGIVGKARTLRPKALQVSRRMRTSPPHRRWAGGIFTLAITMPLDAPSNRQVLQP